MSSLYPNSLRARIQHQYFEQIKYSFGLKTVSGNSSHSSFLPAVGWMQAISSMALIQSVKRLFGPMVVPVTIHTFFNREDHTHYDIAHPHWTSPLGSKLCIVDIDTRPLNNSQQVFNPFIFNRRDLAGTSSGILNHYLYATIHGYRYNFIHTTPYPITDEAMQTRERDDVWTKVSALASVLSDGLPSSPNHPEQKEKREVVISIDSDAIFEHLTLPYEFLMNRWDISPQTSLSLPLDPEWYTAWGRAKGTAALGYTYDSQHKIGANAGFITAGNLPRTLEILKAWDACPNQVAGCDKFKNGWLAEQGAFNDFVRYEFNRSTDINTLACTEGNGFPSQGTECEGVFVRHFTTGKGRLKGAVAEGVARPVVEMVQRVLLESGVRVERVTNGFPEGRRRMG